MLKTHYGQKNTKIVMIWEMKMIRAPRAVCIGWYKKFFDAGQNKEQNADGQTIKILRGHLSAEKVNSRNSAFISRMFSDDE